jgi:hypothetical protein
MKSVAWVVGSVLIGGWTVFASAENGPAQETTRTPWADAMSAQSGQARTTTSSGWKAARGQTTQRSLTEAPPWPATAQRSNAWTDVRGTAVASVQPEPARSPEPVQKPESIAPPPAEGPDAAIEDMNLIPPSMEVAPPQSGEMVPPQSGGYPVMPRRARRGRAYSPVPSSGPGYPMGGSTEGTVFDSGEGCETCGEPCGPTCDPGGGGWGPGAYWGCPPFGWVRDLTVFAGVQAFKGPADWGENGNFGIHEGVNWSTPLGDPWGLGFQVGFEADQSNFRGHGVNPTGDRDQVFVTAGIFQRKVMGGIQWGLAFDLMHDAYYYTADVKQIRGEVAAVWPGWREIGFWGAFGVGRDQVEAVTLHTVAGDLDVSGFTLEPTSQFNFFYRQYFRNGGEGRLWAGFTNNTDFTFGGDLWIPVGTHWAIENSFNVLIPKEGRGTAAREESWGMMVQLVWYPGYSARASRNNPYRPLFNVANNSVFMVDAKY